jgi:hypothetical protein
MIARGAMATIIPVTSKDYFILWKGLADDFSRI